MSSHDHHDHDHDHSHVPRVSQKNEKKVAIAFWLISIFMIVELFGGLYAGSLALIADAGHMLTDGLALGLAWIAFRLGRRPPNHRLTFGYIRFEVLASLFNGLTLFAIAGVIIYEAWQRLNSPPEIMPWPMLLVATIGLVINVVVLWVITRGETENVNIKAAIIHVIGDLLGSVAAIVAAIVIFLTGWAPIDPILSVAVAVLILRSAWKLLRKTTHILLEGAPEEVAPDDVRDYLLQQVAGISNVTHIHLWQISSGLLMATLHLTLHDETQAKFVVAEAKKALADKFTVAHSTIAIDWAADDPASPCELLTALGCGGDKENFHKPSTSPEQRVAEHHHH